MGKQKKTYPEELKRNALNLLRTSGKTGSAVARELGIVPGILNRWRREERAGREWQKSLPWAGCATG